MKDETQELKEKIRLEKVFVMVLEHPEEMIGTEYEILEPTIIGREEGAEIKILDRTISRKHIFLDPQKSKIYFRDLGSKNGVYVNGRKMREGYLKPGDTLRIGRVVFRVELRSTKENEERKKKMFYSDIDELTGLFRKRYFMDRANLLISQGYRFSIIFIDVNKLKFINDNFGHIEGDKALKDLSDAIKKSIRKEDIAARYGGDEFIILTLSHKGVTEEIIKRIKNKTTVEFSYGISSFPEDGKSLEEIISKADKMLYEMKEKERK